MNQCLGGLAMFFIGVLLFTSGMICVVTKVGECENENTSGLIFGAGIMCICASFLICTMDQDSD